MPLPAPKLFFALALAAFALPASAQDAPVPAAAPPATAAAPAPTVTDADPALWVVKDKDTTIYLFGTIHVLKPGLSWFNEAVKAAFDKSDALVLETVVPDAATLQPLVMKLGINSDPKTLPEKLPADQRPALAKALADLGAPANAFDHVDPWLAATNLALLPVQKLGYQSENGPETVLTAAAKAAGKPVTGLETPEQQLDYLDGLSEAAQLDFLESTLKDMPKAGAEIGAMVSDWSKGDTDALAALLNDDIKDTPELKATLLVERNKRWAAWIANRLAQPGTVFVAVGAGHLAGADSVQAQLAAQHITATRVKY